MNTLAGQNSTYTNHNSGSRRKKNSLKHQQQVSSNTLYQIPEYFEEPERNDDSREDSIESLIRGNSNYTTTSNTNYNTFLTPTTSANALTPLNSGNALTPSNSNNTITSGTAIHNSNIGGGGSHNTLDNDHKITHNNNNNMLNNPSRNKYASKLLSNRHVSTASLYQNIMAKRNSNVTIRSGSNGNIVVSDNNGISSVGNGDTECLGHGSIGLGHKDNRGSTSSLNRSSNSSTNSISSNNSIIYDRLQQGINPMTHLELKRTNTIRPTSATIITKNNTNAKDNMKNGTANNNNSNDKKFNNNNDINPRDLFFKRSKSEQTLKSRDFEISRDKLSIDNYNDDRNIGNTEDIGKKNQSLFRSNFVLGKNKKKNDLQNNDLSEVGNLDKNSSNNENMDNKCEENQSKNEDNENISVSSSNQSPLNTTTLTSAVLSRNSSRRNSSNLSTNLLNNISVANDDTQNSNCKSILFQEQPITRAQIKMNAMKSKFDMFNSLNITSTDNIESISNDSNKTKNTNTTKNKSMSASIRAKTLGSNESASPVSTSVLDYIGSASAKQHQPAFPSSLSRRVFFTSSNDSSLDSKNQLNKGYISQMNNSQTETYATTTKYWMVNNDLETRLLNEKINRQLDTIQRHTKSQGTKLLHKHVESCYNATIQNESYMEEIDQVLSAQTSSIEVPKQLNTIDTITSAENIVSDKIQPSVMDAHDLLNFQQKLHSLKHGSSTGNGGRNNYDLNSIKNDTLRNLVTEGLGKIEEIWCTAESSFL
ncbi:hypothetical protein ACO0QE_004105 [Hanseniaspora vineae]